MIVLKKKKNTNISNEIPKTKQGFFKDLLKKRRKQKCSKLKNCIVTKPMYLTCP